MNEDILRESLKFNDHEKCMSYSAKTILKDISQINEAEKTNRVRSNTLFTSDENFLQKGYDNDDDSLNDHENISIFRKEMSSSNFFSNLIEKSILMKYQNELEEDKDNNHSIDSISLEIVKHLGIFDEKSEEDCLNEAKLNLNEDENSISQQNNIIINEESYKYNLNSNIVYENTLSFSSYLNKMNFHSNFTNSFNDGDKRLSVLNNNHYNMNKISNSISQNHGNSIHALSVDFGLNQNNNYFQYPQVINNYNPYNPYRDQLNKNIGSGFDFSSHSIDKKNEIAYNNQSNISSINGSMSKYPNHLILNNPTDKYLVDNLLFLIKDHNGCKLVQKKIEEKNQEFNRMFYESIMKVNYLEYINDQFGNYVFQKFLENTNETIISSFLEKIQDSISIIASNCFGTRVLQKLMEFIHLEKDIEIIKKFIEKNNFMSLIKETNCNHFIQKLITTFNYPNNQFIFDYVTKFSIDICKIKQGGCIIQKALERANEKQKNSLVNELVSKIDKLINDEFGNFVIQTIVHLKIKAFNNSILQFILKNLVELSKQKFSSCVIDKCILQEEDYIKNAIIDKIIETKCVSELLVDQYGNYVIQKSLTLAKIEKRNEILNMIKPLVKVLKKSHFGKKILENLNMKYGNFFGSKLDDTTNSNSIIAKR